MKSVRERSVMTSPAHRSEFVVADLKCVLYNEL